MFDPKIVSDPDAVPPKPTLVGGLPVEFFQTPDEALDEVEFLMRDALRSLMATQLQISAILTPHDDTTTEWAQVRCLHEALLDAMAEFTPVMSAIGY